MSYEKPNFTIITPGGCNAKCSFCTDSYTRPANSDYLANLVNLLTTKGSKQRIPEHFKQVSITGGEPTLSPDLGAILMAVKLSGRFEKVVFTTNGAKLKKHVELLKQTVNHVNISRHAIGYENNCNIFGTNAIALDLELPEICAELNKAGIDVNFNHVYTKDSKYSKEYVLEYIDYAKRMGATSVSFRYDQNENSLEATYLEKMFSGYKVINKGSCPVCRNHSILINGLTVVFKASFSEPSNTIGDVYELIYGINGKLTTDWEGKNEFIGSKVKKYKEQWNATNGKKAINLDKKAVKNKLPVSNKKQIPIISIPVIKTANLTPVYGGGCGIGGGCGY